MTTPEVKAHKVKKVKPRQQVVELNALVDQQRTRIIALEARLTYAEGRIDAHRNFLRDLQAAIHDQLNGPQPETH